MCVCVREREKERERETREGGWGAELEASRAMRAELASGTRDPRPDA